MENFTKLFFDIVTTYNDEIWSRAHNVLMQFSSLGSSKMELSETDFFDTLTIQNDQISYVKHVLAPLYVFFTLFGCWGGVAPKGSRAQPAYAVFQPRQLKNGRPSPLFEVPCRKQ